MPDQHAHDRLRRLHGLSRSVLDHLGERLPPEQVDVLRSFLDAGEFGLFADTVCATLAGRGIAVTRDEHTELSALATAAEGESYRPARHLAEIRVADVPHRFYLRPPTNFYELSEDEQLAWTRQVGQELAARARADEEPDRGQGRGSATPGAGPA